MKIEAIWSAYQNNLKAFLHKNISNPTDVDDLLQEILLKSFQNLTKVKDSKKVKSWLFQIARNTIIDFYRKAKDSEEFDENSLWQSEQELSIFRELSQCILPFINELPAEEANLLRAIVIDGQSQKGYAKQHKIKYSTLKSRVQKSRQKLYSVFNNCCELSLGEHGNLINYQAKKQKL